MKLSFAVHMQSTQSIIFHTKPPRTLYILNAVEYSTECSTCENAENTAAIRTLYKVFFFFFTLSETKMKVENKTPFGRLYLKQKSKF